MPPSARITDLHTCPIHPGGPVCAGDPTVIIGNVPAARVGDGLVCAPGMDLIAQGEPTVLFSNMQAARLGDATTHGGAIAQGCPTVIIGSTAQVEALRTDKPFCEQCERKKPPPEVKGYPPVIIDAHMHIQSGNCAPLPPVRAKAMGLPVSRGFGNALIGIPLLGGWIVGDMGEVAPEPTQVIGARLVSENNGIDFLVGGAGGYFVGVSVVLTMDMDYCHLDGYDGLHIYQEEADGRRYYYGRRNGTDPRDKCRKIYLNADEDLPLDVEEDPGSEAALRAQSRDLDRYLSDLRSDCYETWRQQRRRTEQAVAQNPLRLLPMYHFEPRRYIKDEDRSAPFKALVENGGLYIGFKMYSSQGYMPDESTAMGEKTRDVTRWFFGQCAAQDVPIMTHCTPEGFYTHHRGIYIDLAEESVRERYKNPVDQTLSDDDRLRYFQEHCVHPEAWRPVLQQNPSLRLCLAHWASDVKLWRDRVADFRKRTLTHEERREFERWAIGEGGGSYHRNLAALWGRSRFAQSHAMPSVDANGCMYEKGWIRSIVELCGAFPNFHTDLSYLPIFEKVKGWDGEDIYYWQTLAEILKEYPYMVDKIMFGTDWYLILMDRLGYRRWFEDTIAALEQVQATLGGAYSAHNLFHQFAIVNPIRFYRLGKICAQLKTNLAGAIERLGAEGGVDKARLLSDLERRHLVLAAAVEEARFAKIQAAVKQGPLSFTGPEGWE